jgi:hypothetical protein
MWDVYGHLFEYSFHHNLYTSNNTTDYFLTFQGSGTHSPMQISGSPNAQLPPVLPSKVAPPATLHNVIIYLDKNIIHIGNVHQNLELKYLN